MASYKLSNAAKEDLRRIYAYGLSTFGEQAADDYFYKFFENFERIAEIPFQFPAVNEVRQGYRRGVCGVDSIYYRINESMDNGTIVEIIAILGGQDLETWL
jgi:toxin ParE1/3/4